MKFKIITLGCKVNTYESEYIRENMQKRGFLINEENPDIIIINTCSVTNMADNKSLKTIRKEKREHPNCIMAVCGCSVENNPTKYQDLGIDILIGNKKKSEIPSLIENFIQTKKPFFYHSKNRKIEFECMKVNLFKTHTRAFIKIQDGCDNFCSYCIIPFIRGSIRSKNYELILEEAESLVSNGHKEIVLTGINTGSYNDSGKDLSDLLVALSKIPNLECIRISSIEITELNDKFLNVLQNTPKIANHLHIPLQSGSDNVLKIMNRKYDLNYFKNKIAAIRSIRPNISITTDCLVGHPYETEECFNECLNFCNEIKFSKIHVFPYSIRDNTKSSLMPQIPNDIKKRRAKELIYLSNKLELEYNEQFLGETLKVLTEERSGIYTTGHTSNYLKVNILGEDILLNTEYLCKIIEVTDNNIIGKIVT